jgi:hypothetical protein
MCNINEENIKSILLKSGKLIITQLSGDFYEIDITSTNSELSLEDNKVISNFIALSEKLNSKYRTGNDK